MRGPRPQRSHVPPSPGQSRSELLKGTLDMLILQTLTLQPQHGYAIAQHIERLSNDVLHPALERLQKKGWVTSKWGESPTGRKARYYTITASGRRQLGREISSFDRMLVAIRAVMKRA